MKLHEVDSNSQIDISRQPILDSIGQTTLVNLSIFNRSHKGIKKTIKRLLEADGAGQKTKSEPYIIPALFQYQVIVSTYTNMKLA